MIFRVVQLALSVILVLLILMQTKGVGLKSNFTTYYRTKRGLEKFVFLISILVAILFVLNSIILLVI